MSLTTAELAELRSRWDGSGSLEERLVRSYVAQNTCWSCRADLESDEHANCTGCPEYQAPPRAPGE